MGQNCCESRKDPEGECADERARKPPPRALPRSLKFVMDKPSPQSSRNIFNKSSMLTNALSVKWRILRELEEVLISEVEHTWGQQYIWDAVAS